MTFAESIKTCFTKYADFNGRASRSEWWWFFLFCILVSTILNIVNHSGMLGAVFSLATLLPSLAAQARRLHDTDRSAWFLLLHFLVLIGSIILIVMYTQKGSEGTNRFDAPANPPA